MRVSELEPVYDVRVQNFRPDRRFQHAAPFARLAIHGFDASTDRYTQILKVLDKFFDVYENPVITRLPRSKVRKLPPFYRRGSGEAIPKDATICHTDLNDTVTQPQASNILVGVFFLQHQFPGENRPTWNDARFSKID